MKKPITALAAWSVPTTRPPTILARVYCADILNLHSLDDDSLQALIDRLDESELDDYTDIKTLIGIEFNDNTVERGLFYQALNVVLEVELDDELELDDFEVNFRRMFGNERMDAVMGSMDGSVRFFGLAPTNMKLEGLERHQRLVESHRKLHQARAPGAEQVRSVTDSAGVRLPGAG